MKVNRERPADFSFHGAGQSGGHPQTRLPELGKLPGFSTKGPRSHRLGQEPLGCTYPRSQAFATASSTGSSRCQPTGHWKAFCRSRPGASSHSRRGHDGLIQMPKIMSDYYEEASCGNGAKSGYFLVAPTGQSVVTFENSCKNRLSNKHRPRIGRPPQVLGSLEQERTAVHRHNHKLS